MKLIAKGKLKHTPISSPIFQQLHSFVKVKTVTVLYVVFNWSDY